MTAEDRAVAFVTDAAYLDHFAEGHPERPERLRAILDQLERTGLRARMRALDAREANDAELLAVHDASLIEEEARLAAEQGGWADPDTYVTPRSPAIARRAVGGVLVALEAVLGGEADAAFAAVRPPGHHATADRAMGFCLLNQVAVAAAAALARGLERVAILDWDVHHGNGTQAIFDAEPRVLYASTHAFPFYPGTGHYEESGAGAAAGTKVNVPLPAGAGDEAILAAHLEVILPALERFAPQLVLVSCGWDAHVRDPLAPLQVTTAGYTEVARLAIEAAARLCEGRIVVALEGGYDTHALAWCASALCELLLGAEPTPDPEPATTTLGPDVNAILAAVRREIGLE